MNYPLVSIGIPTFNRAASLIRTLESVIKQDYKNLEIIVSDNASNDNTHAIMNNWSVLDRRIIYIKQDENFGAIKNFRKVMNLANGDFFLWLGDDDWIDQNFVSLCVQFLINNTDYSFVGTDAVFYNSDGMIHLIVHHYNLVQNSYLLRVLKHWYNGAWPFYGLIRKDHLKKTHLLDTVGGDMILISSLAYLGKIKTIQGAFVNRSVHMPNGSLQTLKKMYPDWRSKYINLAVSIYAFNDIVIYNDVYKNLSLIKRVTLGSLVFLTIIISALPKIIRTIISNLFKHFIGEKNYILWKNRLKRSLTK